MEFKPCVSTQVSTSVSSFLLRFSTASSLYLICGLSGFWAYNFENCLFRIFIFVKYSLSCIFFKWSFDSLYMSRCGCVFLSNSRRNSFACNEFSISLILIRENRSSICSDLAVEIRELDMNPFGVSLYFLHLVKKLIFARVAPIFLYILLRSLGILLQEYVSKEKKIGGTVANK